MSTLQPNAAALDRGSIAVSSLGEEARGRFITRTYAHLFGAILAFTMIEVFLFTSGLAETIAVEFIGISWLWVLGGFLVVSWIASRVAHRARSLGAQYAALALAVVAWSVIFVPLLYVAQFKTGGGVIESAAVVTLLGFTGLSAIVYYTRKDFSFLGGVVKWGFLVALVTIVAGALFGFELGTFFSVAMIALAGGAILYDTSNVLHHFPEDRYVGAALELFASLAILFWYVLRLFMSRD